MKTLGHRIGAGFFLLWGVVHVLGGMSLLLALYTDGGVAVYRSLASAAPLTVPETVPGVAAAVAGFHAWNMLWIGAVVAFVAIRYNWVGARSGFWLNVCLAGAADIGLLFALLLPGFMQWSQGLIGIVLFVIAAAIAGFGQLVGTAPTPAATG